MPAHYVAPNITFTGLEDPERNLEEEKIFGANSTRDSGMVLSGAWL